MNKNSLSVNFTGLVFKFKNECVLNACKIHNKCMYWNMENTVSFVLGYD